MKLIVGKGIVTVAGKNTECFSINMTTVLIANRMGVENYNEASYINGDHEYAISFPYVKAHHTISSITTYYKDSKKKAIS